MKLNTTDRADFFSTARNLSPTLGDLFQNPMYLTSGDIQTEIDATYKLLAEQKKLYNAYIFKLGDLICFPEKFKP